MLHGVRAQAMALACLRHSLPAVHARGIDDLPAEAVERFRGALVQRIEPPELARAFHAVMDAFLAEVRAADECLWLKLRETIASLKQSLG
jgi:hypothetical protein